MLVALFETYPRPPFLAAHSSLALYSFLKLSTDYRTSCHHRAEAKMTKRLEDVSKESDYLGTLSGCHIPSFLHSSSRTWLDRSDNGGFGDDL